MYWIFSEIIIIYVKNLPPEQNGACVVLVMGIKSLKKFECKCVNIQLSSCAGGSRVKSVVM